MLYRSLVLAAAFAAAAAFPSHLAPRGLAGLQLSKREARVRELQSANPTATNAACEACVGAEEVLVAKLGAHDAAEANKAQKAEAYAKAADAHDAANTQLGLDETAVANAKAAVGGAVDADQATEVCSLSEAWAAAIAKHAEQERVTAGALKAKEAAQAEDAAADAAVAAAAEEVEAARSGADTACSAMRQAGYDSSAAVAPITKPVAPIVVAPIVAPTQTIYSEDFTDTSDVRHESSSSLVTGGDCYGGSGSCIKFNRCQSAGDVFGVPNAACPSGKTCTLTYKYKGEVLAGGDTDGVKSGSHWWYPYGSGVIPRCDDWCERKLTWPKNGGNAGVRTHVMFETFSSGPCVGYLDDILIVAE